MIFLAAMPMIASFMNYILPLQIGAKDLAFPRINALGFWLIVAAAPANSSLEFGVERLLTLLGLCILHTPVCLDMMVDQILEPLPSFPVLPCLEHSTLSGVNFVTTTFTMRAKGVGWMKMPLIHHGRY